MFNSRPIRPVTTAADLRDALGGDSTSSGVNTPRTRLIPEDQRWLAASTFCFVATSAADGTLDCSPRGDVPGFVHVLDDTTIVLPERAGNRRADGGLNLLQNGHIGLIFLIPPRKDTLRINGRATLVRDAPWFPQLAVRGVEPVLAIIVDIEELFYHCVKAFTRSGFWDPRTWRPEAAPSRAEVAGALSCPIPVD